MRSKAIIALPALLALLALGGGTWCLVRSRIAAGALAGSAHDVARPHKDVPPHGGTPVGLGDDQFNVELVRDAASGTLQAYILDGEMEDYIRISAPALDLQIDRNGRKTPLRLLPVADPATGETVGDTCLFRAKADWLKQTDHFKGVIKRLAIQDQTFQAVAFAFPEGNGKD